MNRRARQREFGFTNWGGKRRGAGRKPKGERAGVSHAKRPRLCARHPVLVTLRLRSGLPNLRYDAAHELLKNAFAASSRTEAFRVVEYSVQSNHLHLIAESRSERALASGMIGLLVRIARRLNALWKRAGKVFSDRYHARALTTPSAVRIALIYVLQNARKHGCWIARKPDVYSSGPSFDGWKPPTSSARPNPAPRSVEARRRGPPEFPVASAATPTALPSKAAESSPRWLARARTWLLSIGWRKHGLLDPREIPLPT
jgi:putative transposase